MNIKRVILPLLLALASTPLYAGHGHGKHRPQGQIVKARVTHVEPIIEHVQVPREVRECWNEEVHGTQTRRSGNGALVGAIIGGVIGHNIGNSRNRPVATAVGSLIGAGIGRDTDRVTHTPYRYTEQHCALRTEYSEERRISGYRVHYRFRGEEFVTHMDHDPGKFVRLGLSHRLLD